MNKYIHQLTYWSPETLDRYGKPTWSPPTVIKCRWEDSIEKFVNNEGEIDVSRAMVMVPERLEPGVYIYKGVSNQATPPNTAWEVKQYKEVDNVLGTRTDRVVII